MSMATRASPLAAARKTIPVGAGPDGRTKPSVNIDEPDSSRATGKPPRFIGHNTRAKPSSRETSQVTSSEMSQVGPEAARIRSRCLRSSTLAVTFRNVPRTAHAKAEPKTELDDRG